MTDDEFVDIQDFLSTDDQLVEIFPASTITGWVGGRKGDPDAERFCLHPGTAYRVPRDVAREWAVLGYVQIGAGDIGPTPSEDEAEEIRARSRPVAPC